MIRGRNGLFLNNKKNSVVILINERLCIMKKSILFGLVFAVFMAATICLGSNVSASKVENGYYAQSFYFVDLEDNEHLIATNYADDKGEGYSYVYEKDGNLTKYDSDSAVDKAYQTWVEGTYNLHYFSALRFSDEGDRRIQRVGVDINRNVYALCYKCINHTDDVEAEDEVLEINASNTFGFRRRQYTKYDTMVYYWEKLDDIERNEVLLQLGPDSLDDLDPSKTTVAPTTEAPTTTAVETTTKKAEVKIAKATVTSVKKKKSAKKAKIAIKKIASASGYDIQVAKNKKFNKVLYKKSATKNTVTITNAKFKNVVIYVRARGYKKIDGVKKVGPWSAAKKSK